MREAVSEQKTGEEMKSTYPEYTVYVHYSNDGDISVQPWNYYADRGKTYKECSDALAKKFTGFTERQDKDLYNLAMKNEKNKSKVDVSEFAARLRNISYEIDSLLEDCEE